MVWLWGRVLDDMWSLRVVWLGLFWCWHVEERLVDVGGTRGDGGRGAGGEGGEPSYFPENI